ncbi:DUF4214 domain-containing protein [Duganella sp. BuS-21]|uniref:DUF4214 domain-containing protein n=1 Tax=Duganella sp. BuS-21 TaxID=2943848 RepID=UPI0035A70F3E
MASKRTLAGILLPLVLLSACGGGGDSPAPAAAAKRMGLTTGPVLLPVAKDYHRLVQMIYVGYFGRPADPAGLSYYAQTFAANSLPITLAGFSEAYGANPVIRQTIDGFATSQESQDLYPGDNDTFVTAIYKNLFNRAPDTLGKEYWVQQLNAGLVTRGSAALSIMAGAQTSDITIIDVKADLASSFTTALDTPARIVAYSGMAPNESVRQLLQQVATSADAATQAPLLETLVQTLLAAAPPAGAPGAIELTGASGGDGLAILPFSGPSSGAGVALSYSAVCIGDGVVTSATAPTSPVIVSGLPNDMAQTCAVRASNGVGAGPISAAVSVTPKADGAVWAAPTALTATGLATSSAGRAFLAFTAPPRINGAAPAAYLASCTGNGETRYGHAAASPVMVEGLRNGLRYQCAVRAAGSVTASAAVVVDVPLANPNRLQYIYAYPTDRTYNAGWSRALQASAAHLQQWFKSQLGGPTFTVQSVEPKICQLPGASAAYFDTNTWSTVAKDLRDYCGVDYSRTDTDWIVYADVLHKVDTPGRLGAGAIGLAMFPRQDLEGMGGAPCVVSDEGVTYCFDQIRWSGGGAHEIGHTLGVPHPAGCDGGLPTCDSYAANSIMWTGYTIYPDTYFVPEAKTILLNSRFIR